MGIRKGGGVEKGKRKIRAERSRQKGTILAEMRQYRFKNVNRKIFVPLLSFQLFSLSLFLFLSVLSFRFLPLFVAFISLRSAFSSHSASDGAKSVFVGCHVERRERTDRAAGVDELIDCFYRVQPCLDLSRPKVGPERRNEQISRRIEQTNAEVL